MTLAPRSAGYLALLVERPDDEGRAAEPAPEAVDAPDPASRA